MHQGQFIPANPSGPPQAAAEALPYPAAAFDAVTMVYLLHELPPEARRAAAREAARVLAPGGVLVVRILSHLIISYQILSHLLISLHIFAIFPPDLYRLSILPKVSFCNYIFMPFVHHAAAIRSIPVSRAACLARLPPRLLLQQLRQRRRQWW